MTRPLVDATLLNDELDLLLLRMERLSADVEHFYVAESAESYTGISKPLHLSENLDRFAEYADRMTVIVYGGSDQHVGWKREEIARESLRQAVSTLAPETIVYFSDLDEFPSSSQIASMREIDGPRTVPLDTYYRRANWRLEAESPILVAKATPVATLPSDFTKFRWPDEVYPELGGERGGHFSYLGFGADRLAAKVAAFSHAEYLFAMEESHRLLSVADRLALDHFGRSRLPGAGILTVLPVAQWSELHHWLHARRPDWFEPRKPRGATWRRVNAAVIDDAMVGQDLAQLRTVGSVRALLQPGARRVLRSRLRGVRERLRL